MVYSYGDDRKFQDINYSFKDSFHTTFIDLQKPGAFLRAQTTLPPTAIVVSNTTMSLPQTKESVAPEIPKATTTATKTTAAIIKLTTTTTSPQQTTTTTTTTTTKPKTTTTTTTTITTPALPKTTSILVTSHKCDASCNCTSKNATLDGEL